MLALAIALVGVAQTVSPAYADGGGAASGYVSNTPLTAQQQKQLDAKNPDPINTTDIGSVR